MDGDQTTTPNGNCNQVNQADFADQLPPGYRFCPTDSELIVDYLNAKIESRKLPECRLHEVNIYMHKPEELAERYRSSENNWYFLTPRDRRYANGNRPSRAVGELGYWRTTQKHKPVHDHTTGQMVGHKGSLAFHNKENKKTFWLMHEYTTNGPNLPFGSGENKHKLNEWVLCKIYTKDPNESAIYRKTTKRKKVNEERNRTPERSPTKRRRISESDISNHHEEHVEVQEANRCLGTHDQTVTPVEVQRSVNNGLQFSNDAFNSSSTEPQAAAQPLDYGGLAPSLVKNDALQQNVQYDVHQQHFQMLYQNCQSQLHVQNGSNQNMAVLQDAYDHTQLDDYCASDTDNWSIENFETVLLENCCSPMIIEID